MNKRMSDVLYHYCIMKSRADGTIYKSGSIVFSGAMKCNNDYNELVVALAAHLGEEDGGFVVISISRVSE